MKCFAWRKKILCALWLLFLSFALLWGRDMTAQAAEKATGEESGGILQNGDLLEEKKSSEIKTARLRGNTQGAKQAFMSALEQVEPGVNLEGYQITADELRDIASDVVNNNPKYFYYEGYSYNYYTSTNIVIQLTFKYKEDKASIRTKKGLYEAAVQKILSTVESSWSDLEKALYVNDYLAANCEYDSALEKYSAYNVFVDKTAVCQGYALAYQELMNRLNIPCQFVSSDPLKHAWNLVQIAGNWYHVDVTWNDPVKDMPGRARHYYFMKSTEWFQSTKGGNHITDDGMTQYVYSGNATDGAASRQTYDGYFWNNIDSTFGPYGGYWYANQGGVLYRYKIDNSGMTESVEYKKLNQHWPVFNGSGFWRGNYDGCVVYGNKLYYATPSEIQVLDLTDSSVPAKTAYTLSNEELSSGYIYGFYIDLDGMLYYGISESPNIAAVVHSKSLHTHTYGAWVVVKEAGCEESGERTQVCSGCGRKKTEVVAAAGHKPGKAATCTEAQTCTVCKKSLAAALGHKPGKAAACTEAQTCTVCKGVIKEATGHLHKKTATQAATFTRDGKRTVTCSDCGKVLESKKIAKIKCKKGQTYKVGNYKYKIVSNNVNGKGTVSFAGLAKNVKKVAIYDTVKIHGSTFKIIKVEDKALKNKSSVTAVTIGKNVTAIGKESFSGAKKLKTITIKSTKIKKVGAKAFQNIYSRAKIKVPRTSLQKYRALMKNKGQKKTVKIC